MFIAHLMAISAPMATINMRSRTNDYTAMARVAQKWLQLKKYWHYRFQSYCIRLQIKFRIRWSALISDKPFFACPERCLDVPDSCELHNISVKLSFLFWPTLSFLPFCFLSYFSVCFTVKSLWLFLTYTNFLFILHTLYLLKTWILRLFCPTDVCPSFTVT